MSEQQQSHGSAVGAFHAQFEWRRALREARERRKLSQAQVAQRAALSASAVRAYENGSRHPTLDALDAMITAMGLAPEEATPIRAGAGYAVDLRFIIYGKYEPRPMDVMAAEIERYPWPACVLNQVGEAYAMNAPFYAMLGPSLATLLREDPDKRNFMALISDPRFADRIENWDEVFAFIIGLAKGETRVENNLERPAANTQDVMRKFLLGDPRYITRVLTMWQQAPALEHWTRHQYRFRWRLDDGRVLRFWCIFHVADVWNELFWSDYVPEDAETWEALRTLAPA